MGIRMSALRLMILLYIKNNFRYMLKIVIIINSCVAHFYGRPLVPLGDNILSGGRQLVIYLSCGRQIINWRPSDIYVMAAR